MARRLIGCGDLMRRVHLYTVWRRNDGVYREVTGLSFGPGPNDEHVYTCTPAPLFAEWDRSRGSETLTSHRFLATHQRAVEYAEEEGLALPKSRREDDPFRPTIIQLTLADEAMRRMATVKGSWDETRAEREALQSVIWLR